MYVCGGQKVKKRNSKRPRLQKFCFHLILIIIAFIILTFRTENDCFLYGVFDGHHGSRAAHFTSERLPAELLLGQLTPGSPNDAVKSILAQAFSVVEHGFFESIDVELAKRTHLQSQVGLWRELNLFSVLTINLPGCLNGIF